MDSNAATKNMKETHERVLTAMATEKRALEEKLADAEQSAASKDDVTNGANLSEQLETAKAQLQDANSELTGLRDLAQSLRTELMGQKQMTVDIRDRLERELSSHGQTAQTVVELRDKVRLVFCFFFCSPW